MDIFIHLPSKPPTYEQALKSEYLPEEPPSYSIFTDEEETSGKLNRFVSSLRVFAEYISFIVAVIFLFLIPFSSLIIGMCHALVNLAEKSVGIIFWNDCPIEPLIPAYLIVVGLIGAVRNCVAISEPITLGYPSALSSAFIEDRSNILIFFDCVNLAWFSLGNIWLVQAAILKNDNNINTSCNPILFWYSFCSIMLFYVTIILTLLLYIILNRQFLLKSSSHSQPPSYYNE